MQRSCDSKKNGTCKYIKKASMAEVQRLRQDVGQDKMGEIGWEPVPETLLQAMLYSLVFMFRAMGIF